MISVPFIITPLSDRLGDVKCEVDEDALKVQLHDGEAKRLMDLLEQEFQWEFAR